MRRRVGIGLLGLGLLLLAWLAVTLAWGDPVTSIYTRHEQAILARRLDRAETAWPRAEAASSRAATRTVLAARARVYAGRIRDGEAIGRIWIPRLHLRMVVVEGTSEADLEKGPGHYDRASGIATSLPGMGRVVAIAGHRTTYLHPFRHIDALRPGDGVYLEMPYGTFRYVVFAHEVVTPTDWSILRPRRRETLVLTACHPLYSASHRWVVFARLRGEGRT